MANPIENESAGKPMPPTDWFLRVQKHLDAEDKRYEHLTMQMNGSTQELTSQMSKIESDLSPIKKLYFAVLGSAGVGSLLLLVLIFIYNSDRGQAREEVRDRITELSTLSKAVQDLRTIVAVQDSNRMNDRELIKQIADITATTRAVQRERNEDISKKK